MHSSSNLPFLLLLLLCGIIELSLASEPSFQRMSKEEGMKRLIASDAWMHQHVAPHEIVASLPPSFDAREQWPGCIHPVLNQGACGSCWAFAASEVLSDRYCIESRGRINVTLSPQNLLSCEFWNAGCAMGSPPNFAWDFLVSTGIPTMSCNAYKSGRGENYSCPSKCDDGSSISKRYKAKSKQHVGSFLEPSSHINEIMKALVTSGPLDATFNVWGDFMDYKGGVYEHKYGSYKGLHSVKIIGYGTHEGIPYWLIQNSWGSHWGPYNGTSSRHFMIKRGSDECFIEAAVYTGAPDLSVLYE